MNVAVYCTDHGWGHVTRQLAWIEKQPWKKEDKVFLINSYARKLVEESSVPNLISVPRDTDPGLVTDHEKFSIDKEATLKLLQDYWKNVDLRILQEKEFLKRENIDLVISDIVPYPFEAASDLGIESLAISSFSWHWVYSDMFGNEANEILDRMKEMYRKADMAYVLPLGEDMDIFPRRKKIPLIARIDLGEPREPEGVTISMGKSAFPSLEERLSPKYKYFIPEHLIKRDLPNVERIPGSVHNLEDYFRRSYFVIAKTGYSSVAECIALKKPILGIKRRGCIEDEYIGKAIERLGIGKAIFFEDLNLDIIENFDNLEFNKNYEIILNIYENEINFDIFNII